MDSLQRKKRSANITNEQRSLLVEYMKEHPQLTHGKFSSSFTLKDSIHLWNEITYILNAVNGAKKDWKDWRKCWHDFQSRSKKKFSTIKQSMAKTGGGTINTESLTTQEEQVLDIMCSTSITGHPEIEESTVNILEIPEEEIMDIEYLDEDEENILNINNPDTDINSNDCNIMSQTNKTNIVYSINNKKCTLQTLVSGKKNIDSTSRNYTDIKKSTAKFDKPITESRVLLNITNSSIQNMENNNKKQTPLKRKESHTPKKELKNTIEVSAHLNNIYEKSYELKKNFYERKLEYLRRFVEAHEKLTNIFEKSNFSD